MKPKGMERSGNRKMEPAKASKCAGCRNYYYCYCYYCYVFRPIEKAANWKTAILCDFNHSGASYFFVTLEPDLSYTIPKDSSI
jgi:hypothetical protein